MPPTRDSAILITNPPTIIEEALTKESTTTFVDHVKDLSVLDYPISEVDSTFPSIVAASPGTIMSPYDKFYVTHDAQDPFEKISTPLPDVEIIERSQAN